MPLFFLLGMGKEYFYLSDFQVNLGHRCVINVQLIANVIH
jgi:hypothetical protein